MLQLGLVWQAKQAVAAKKAAEEAEKVRSSRALDGFGLRRTASDACSCAEWQQCYYSDMSALCRTRAMRWRVRVHTAGGREAACAFAWLWSLTACLRRALGTVVRLQVCCRQPHVHA